MAAEKTLDKLKDQRRALPDAPGVYLFRDAERPRALRGQGQLHPQARRLALQRQDRARVARVPLQGRLVRLHRDRERGRGPAGRAALHQAAPAAVQHPPARRQVLPVHRASRSRSASHACTSRESGTAPSGRTSGRSRVPSACARRSTCWASCSRTARATARSRAARRAARAWTTTSSAARPPASTTSARPDYRANIEAIISFLSGQLPRDRARAGAADERPRPRPRSSSRRPCSATGCARCARCSSASGSQAARSGTLDVLAVAVDGTEANAQVFQVRDGVLADRQSFYLENRAGRSEAEVAEEFAIQYYSTSLSIPAEIVGPPLAGRGGGGEAGAGGAARRPGRASATPGAARSAGCTSWRSATRGSRSSRTS